MRSTILLCWLLLASVSAPTQAHDYRSYTNGKWWDGRAFVPRVFYSVDGVLHPNPVPTWKADEVDLAGGYVIPACGEAHNHAATADHPEALRRFINEGILYAKNPENINQVRQGPLVNVPDGVDIIFANGAFTAPEGHPLVLVKRGGIQKEDSEGNFYNTIETERELKAKWPKLLATKPDFIKVILVYSEEFEKRRFRPGQAGEDPYFSRRGLDPALIKPIVALAKKANLPVVAHVESAADFHVAVEAGVSEINHMPGFWPTDDAMKSGDFSRYRILARDARQAAGKHIDVVMTIGASTQRALSDKDHEIGNQLLALYRENLQSLRRNGVKILMGSDQFRYSSRDEVLAIGKAGLMSNADLIKSWCEATPRAIFPNRHIGALRDGYEANMVVLEADPLEDIANIAKVRAVFKGGKKLATVSEP